MSKIIIATIKSWNITNALKLKNKYDIELVTKKEELTVDFVKKFNPEYIFFPHWSWIIPEEIYQNYNCIVFHMTDLPFGRGGSPLQNLILRKTYDTKISAIKVEKEIDAGKIYLKEEYNIKFGSAEEIFIDVSNIIFSKMIPSIMEKTPVLTQQVGEPVYFKRRKPEESEISNQDFYSLDDIYDFIRMLDAEDYPKAFFRFGNFKIMFSEVHKKSDKLVGRYEIYDER